MKRTRRKFWRLRCWRWRRSPLSGGQISLQISPPEEEQRVAAAPRRKLGKQLLFWGFRVTGINRSFGRAPEEEGGPQAARGRGPTPRRARGRLGPPGLPSGPTSGIWLLQVRGFSCIFLGILWDVQISIFLQTI